MRVTIQSKGGSAVIDTLGAQLVSFQDALGNEYLWQGDANYWSGQAPVLFPIVGALREGRATIEGKAYEMKRHGFARRMEFELVEREEDRAVFSLKANGESKTMYPFDFELRIAYRIEGTKLFNDYIVCNHDSQAMPFAVGGHPAFNCPVEKEGTLEDYQIEFERAETADCPAIDLNTGLIDFNNCKRMLEEERVLPLRHSVFYGDALVFDQLKSNKVRLVSRKSGRGVEMDFTGFAYLGIWSAINDAPFVALEPWTGCATCTDEDNTLEHKRGMTLLQPGESFQVGFSVDIL